MMRRALADELVDAPQQAHAQPPLAAQQRHRLGVLAHVHEVGAEARLAVGLRVVEPDQRAPEADGRAASPTAA